MSRRCYRLGSFLFGFHLFVLLLPADTVPVSWIGPDMGNWSVASNWSTGVVPNNSGGNTYDVTMPLKFPSGSVRSVVVDTSPTINSLSVITTRLEVPQSLTAGTILVPAIPRGVSTSIINVDAGATLDAGSVNINSSGGGLSIQGTATIGTLSLVSCGGCPFVSVDPGGLLNLGSFSGGGQFTSVSGGGTLNMATNLTISGLTGGFDIFGAVTVGTGNLLPLNSPNTLVNAGAIVIAARTAGIGVGGVPCGSPLPCGFEVLPGGTYNEVIGGPNSFGTVTVTPPPFSFLPISLAGTLRITLADSYVPPVGQTFTIMTGVGDGLAGTFSNIEGQTFNNGTEMWDVDYIFDQRAGLSKVELVAVPVVPEPSFFWLAGLGLLGIVWAHRLSHSPAHGSRPSRGI